jgi:hypothetical protein
MPIHDNLSGRAAELAYLTDLIRTSLSLADAAIPLLRRRFAELEDDLATAGQRMAREKDDARYEALARAFDEMKTEREGAARRIEEVSRRSTSLPAGWTSSPPSPPRRPTTITACRSTRHTTNRAPRRVAGAHRSNPVPKEAMAPVTAARMSPSPGWCSFAKGSNVGATRFERATSTSRT